MPMFNPAEEALARGIADFQSVASALGFDVRRDRAACIICGASNPTTCSFDFEQGFFHCFRCGAKGGVLNLIQAVHECDRRSALRWLADFVGVSLGSQQASADRARYAVRRAVAERAAAELVEWRVALLERLRAERNLLYENEAVVSAWARMELASPSGDQEDLWAYVWEHAFDNEKGTELDELVDSVENSTVEDLVDLRNRMERGTE